MVTLPQINEIVQIVDALTFIDNIEHNKTVKDWPIFISR